MVGGIYGPDFGRNRRYVMTTYPYTLLATGRLHSERYGFRDLAHMLDYWLFHLYSAAVGATLEAPDASTKATASPDPYAVDVCNEIEMVKMLAEGAGRSDHETETLVHRALDAGQAAAKFFLETGTLDDAEFYPWFIPGEWGTGETDADRAVDLAVLEKRVADLLRISGTPGSS